MRDVILDLDGVLLDFESAWVKQAVLVLERPVARISNVHEMGVRYGLTDEEKSRVWDACDNGEFWSDIPLLPHARELVDGLEDMGFRVFGVTAVHPELLDARVSSLDGLIPSGRLVCVGAPKVAGAADKTDAIHRIRPLAFLDDHPAHVDQAANAGVPISVWLDNGCYADVPPPEHIDVAVINHPMDFLENLRSVAG